MFDIFPSSQMIFIMGMRKSGTSWVRSILNTHPSVSARLEDKARQILHSLRTSLSSYNRTLRETQWHNQTTESVRTHSSSDYHDLIRFYYEMTAKKTIEELDKPKANTVVFRDFTLTEYFGLFAKLFPSARFIYVTRDPRDVAVSTWFHHKRIQDGFEEKAGNLQYHGRVFAKEWIKDYNRIFFHPDINNVLWHIVRFEDLQEDFEQTVEKLFQFIGVKKVEKGRIAKIKEQTSFAVATGGRQNGELVENAYFRQGIAGGWQELLEERTLSIMEAIAGRHMQSLSYLEPKDKEDTAEYDANNPHEKKDITPALAQRNLKELASKSKRSKTRQSENRREKDKQEMV